MENTIVTIVIGELKSVSRLKILPETEARSNSIHSFQTFLRLNVDLSKIQAINIHTLNRVVSYLFIIISCVLVIFSVYMPNAPYLIVTMSIFTFRFADHMARVHGETEWQQHHWM